MFGEPDVERLWEAVASVGAARRARSGRGLAGCTSRQAPRALPSSSTALAFDAVRFTGPGHRPDGRPASRRAMDRAAAIETVDGIAHVPNLPTEEVFTAPTGAAPRGRSARRGRSRSAARSSRDLEMRFEAGKCVEVKASAGADAVRGADGQRRLRHARSARSRSSTASRASARRASRSSTRSSTRTPTCHIAYGAAVTFGIDGLDGLSPDELRARGHQRLVRAHRLHDRRPGGGRRRHHQGRHSRPDPAGGRMAAVAPATTSGSRRTPTSPFASARTCRRDRRSSSSRRSSTRRSRVRSTRAAYRAGARYVDVALPRRPRPPRDDRARPRRGARRTRPSG